MNAQQNAPISDRFSSLCARVFSPAAAILESEKTLGTRLQETLAGRRKDCCARARSENEQKRQKVELTMKIDFYFIFLCTKRNIKEYRK